MFLWTELLKRTGGSVNYLIIKILKNVYTQNMNFCQPSPQSYIYNPHAYANLPHHGEMFCTKERLIVFGPLGVITL